VQLLVIIDIH